MSNITIVSNIESLEFEVSGYCSLGAEPRFDKTFGNWVVGEQPRVENLKVCLVRGDKALDVTEFLPNQICEMFKDELLEELCLNGDDVA